MKSIKFFLWRWFICPWRVYYHLKRWPNSSAAIKYIRENTKWPLKKCKEYVDNKYGRYVWIDGCSGYKIGPVILWEYPRIVRDKRRKTI